MSSILQEQRKYAIETACMMDVFALFIRIAGRCCIPISVFSEKGLCLPEHGVFIVVTFREADCGETPEAVLVRVIDPGKF